MIIKFTDKQQNCFVGVLLFFFSRVPPHYTVCPLVLSCRFPTFPPGLSVSLLACLPLYPVFVVLSSFFLFLKYLPFFSFIFLSFFLLPTYFPSVKWFALTSKHNPNTLHWTAYLLSLPNTKQTSNLIKVLSFFLCKSLKSSNRRIVSRSYILYPIIR